ncbi:nucleoside-diphosphate-sugar epimerase [Flavobacterium sp. 28YEA47A]|uniref:SDR family oxidoreductase n=1 Tax=Flavobacterium sp. 28YEA47A TaxID=3156276 RepID=UPI0035164199
MPQISILGCGWLGLPLAKDLLEKGFSVNGSTTSENKLSILESSEVKPFLVTVSPEGIQGNLNDFLKDSEILIIDIPPKLKGDTNENFVAKIQNLALEIEKSSIKKVLFISSTSVYTDAENIPVITEEDIPNPDTKSGRQLFESENLLLNNPKFSTTILRFGGLIGEDRHPVKFLSGRENIENADGPINLIHQKDCIGVILKIIEKDCWNTVFNAVAPIHPSRKEYYTQKAESLGLDLPKFNAEKKSVGKIIDSSKLKAVLDYKFGGI